MKKERIAELSVIGACLLFCVAMISPTLESSRERIHRARCICNLKRLWQAFTAYVQEHKGRLPLSGMCDRNLPQDWTWGGNVVAVPQSVDLVERIEIEKGAIWPYLYGSFVPGDMAWYGDACKNPYLCPSAGAVGRKRGLAYSMNYELGHYPDRPSGTEFGVVLEQVSSPEKIFLLLEENELTINDGSFVRQGPENDIPQTEVHDGGANHLFCDGHVWRLSRAQLEEKMASGEGFKWEVR